MDFGLSTETDGNAFYETLDVTRLDATGNTIGNWRVEQGRNSTKLGNMRHFAAVKDGTYVIRFPEFPVGSPVKVPPKNVNLGLENMLAANDSTILGVHFDGAALPQRVFLYPTYQGRSGANSRNMASGANLAAVSAGAGNVYWRDTANTLVWVKIVPFTTNFWMSEVADSDNDLYRSISLRIQ